MNIIKKLVEVFFSRTFFLYIIFGGLATVVDWSSFWIAAYRFNVYYLLAVTISFSLGSITNFVLNKILNFKNKYERWMLQFMVYLLVALVGLGITLLLMWALVGGMLMNKMVARIIVTGIVLIYNFIGHKYITFRILK